MTEFIYAIGDFFYIIFGWMEKMANIPNVIITLLGFFGLGYWLLRQVKFNKEAEHTKGLK